MKKILFLLFALISLTSFGQVPDTSRAKKVYGNMIWVKYDTTAATWDTLGIFPGATPEIWSSSGDLGYLSSNGDTVLGKTYLFNDGKLYVQKTVGGIPSCGSYELTTVNGGQIDFNTCDGSYGYLGSIGADSLISDGAYIVSTPQTTFTGDLIVKGANGIQVERATATTYDHRILYNMLASKTVANTTTPTSLFNDAGAIGTRTIPANFLKAGTTIRIHMRGDLSNTGNPTNTMDIELGGKTISSTTATLGTALSNSICEIEMDIVVRSIGSDGTVVGAGYAYVVSGITRSLLATTPITINTTESLSLDVVYTWGAANAANTLTMLTGSIEILY